MTSPDAPFDAVLDTNVVLDWLVFREPSVAALVSALENGRLRWVATPSMLEELEFVLCRPGLERWSERLATAQGEVERWCARVAAPDMPPGQALWCSDPDDQKFIDLALARRVPWLFSRDRALLKLAHRALPRGVTVLSPDRWPALDRQTAPPPDHP